MASIAERTVLTTGANSGIGLATTLALAKRGFHSVGSVRSPSKAAKVQEAAADRGVEVETVLLDVTDAERCRAVIDSVRPWGLVNNAGFGHTGAIEDVEDDEAQQLIDTMVMAPMRLARLALPHMRDAGGGRIVNMSSILGLTSGPLMGWYSGAKHALEALSDALRVEESSGGVQVIIVEPGGIRTDLWEEVAEGVDQRTGSRFERAYRRTVTGTKLTQPFMGSADSVASTVVRALTSRLPRQRYLVGMDAQALALAQRVTPGAVRDVATKLGLGL